MAEDWRETLARKFSKLAATASDKEAVIDDGVERNTRIIRGPQDVYALNLPPEVRNELLAELAAATPPPVALTRCSMCGTPGELTHKHLGDCVDSLRHKMADFTGDCGWLPAPSVPPLSFMALKARAMANLREKRLRGGER